MKNKLLILVVMATLFGFSTCEKMPVSKSGGDDLLRGEKIEAEQSKFLDTIFSEKNDLIPKDDMHIDFDIYVINSLEELDVINPFGYKIDIDWSEYTLVGARITISTLTPDIHVSDLEEQANDYLLNVKLDYSKGGNEAFGNLYFWRLYPKLESNKDVILKITNYYGE